MSTVTASDSYIKLVVTENANTTSAVSLTLSLIAVSAVRDVQGTFRFGSNYTTISDQGSYGAGNTIAQKTLYVSYGSSSSLAFTTEFSGTFDVLSPSYTEDYSDTLTGYYYATKPESVAISLSSTSVNLGSSMTITTSGASSTDKIKWTVGSTSDYVTSSAVGNTSTSWTPPLATFAGFNTGGTTIDCTLSWNGATKTLKLVIPENSSTKPAISSITMSIVDSYQSSDYVQNKSKAKATIATSTKYSATISSYSVTIDGTTYNSISNSITSNVLTTSGSNTCSVTVTDSRGFTATSSTTFTVTAYSSPSLSSVQIYRSDSSGTKDSSGAYLTYKFTPTITALTENTKKYGLQYRVYGNSSWSSFVSNADLSSYTAAVTYTKGGSLSTTSQYQARIYITDLYGSVYSSTFNIGTESVMLDFSLDGTGCGIGMYNQGSSRLDIAWPTYVYGNLKISGGNVTIAGSSPSSSYVQLVSGDNLSSNRTALYQTFASVNGIYSPTIFRIRSYSHDSTTGEVLSYRQDVLFPAVPADLSSHVTEYVATARNTALSSAGTVSYDNLPNGNYLLLVGRYATTATTNDSVYLIVSYASGNSHATPIIAGTATVTVSGGTVTVTTVSNYSRVTLIRFITTA